MKEYELLYIVEADMADDKREALIEKVGAMIASNGGETSEPEKWGVRKYAYPINYKNEGYYVLVNFKLAADKIATLKNQLLITEGVVRYMIVAK